MKDIKYVFLLLLITHIGLVIAGCFLVYQGKIGNGLTIVISNSICIPISIKGLL